MAKEYWNDEEEKQENDQRNMFRCALSLTRPLIGAIDNMIGAFIHKALYANRPTVVS